MKHDGLSQDELKQRLEAAALSITVGARYRHYKEQNYTVLALALREEDNEPCVIYKAEYGNNITFIRPVTNWLETVEHAGRQVPRFQQV
jgi:cyclomaltodextrinase